MKGITRKVMVPLLLSHVVAALGLLLYHILAGSSEILPEFTWQWTSQAVLVSWIDLFIPITISGFVLGFSVFISTAELRSVLMGDRSFVRIAGKSVVLVLVLAMVFVALTAFVHGSARQQRDTLHSRSTRAHAYLTEAQDLSKNGQTLEAIQAVKKAIMSAPNYLAAINLESRLVDRSGQEGLASGTAGEASQSANESTKLQEPEGLAPKDTRSSLVYADNINQAREYLDRGDNYSALYFVRKAEEMVARQDPALIDIRTEAEKNIRKTGISIEDQNARALYEAKQRAIVDYYQNNRPIEAYYQLLEVEAMVNGDAGESQSSLEPNKDYKDADVRRWMPEILALLEKNSFFRDEAEALVADASGAGVMFINRDENGIREYVYAQAVLHGRFNQYLLSPEIIVVSADGNIQLHRISAFGKIVGANLIMKSISRTDPNQIDEVRVLAGTIDAETRNVVRLHQSPDVIWNLSQSRFGYQAMSVPELISLIDVVPSAGYDVLPLQSVILSYLLQVLSLPSLCFFAIGWGWSNRNRYLTRPIVLMVLMVFAVPALLFVVLKLYQFVGSCLNSSLLILSGFETALLVLVLVQAVQLVISLVYMAGQSTD